MKTVKSKLMIGWEVSFTLVLFFFTLNHYNLSGCYLPFWLSDLVTNGEVMLYLNISQELRLIPANSTVQIGYQLYLECPGKG